MGQSCANRDKMSAPMNFIRLDSETKKTEADPIAQINSLVGENLENLRTVKQATQTLSKTVQRYTKAGRSRCTPALIWVHLFCWFEKVCLRL